MLDLIQELPPLAYVLVLAIVAGLYIYELFDKRKRKRDQDFHNSSNDFIELLKNTKEELLRENADLRSKMEVLIERNETLENKYNSLVEIVKGTDETTKVFRTSALEAIELSKQTHDLLVVTHSYAIKIDHNAKKIRDKLDELETRYLHFKEENK